MLVTRWKGDWKEDSHHHHETQVWSNGWGTQLGQTGLITVLLRTFMQKNALLQQVKRERVSIQREMWGQALRLFAFWLNGTESHQIDFPDEAEKEMSSIFRCCWAGVHVWVTLKGHSTGFTCDTQFTHNKKHYVQWFQNLFWHALLQKVQPPDPTIIMNQ